MRSQRYGSPASFIYSRLIDPLLAPLRPKLVQLCLRYDIDSVLDIGTATGAQCRALHAAGIRAMGLDVSLEMIASAKALSAETISFVAGSAFKLPFEDESINAALLSLALHEQTESDRSRMLSEAMRVVRPGGHLIVVEYSQPAHTFVHIPWLVIRVIENLAGGTHRTGFFQFMVTGGLKGLLRRHGLCATEIVYSHFHTLAIAVLPVVR